MDTNPTLFIPVILGTSRQGSTSEHVAKFVVEEVTKRDGVETELIDIRKIPISTTDAGESMQARLVCIAPDF